METQPINSDHPIARSTFTTILSKASSLGEHRFARQAALAWLASFPGDLAINCTLAQALYEEGKPAQAASIVTALGDKDPEFLAAYELRANSVITAEVEQRNQATAHLVALGGVKPAGFLVPEWSRLVLQLRKAITDGKLENAEDLAHQAMAKNPDSPLPAIYDLQLAYLRNDMAAVQNIANVYHARWPECIQFTLALADAIMKDGDETQAVALLHRCVAQDAAAQVATRMWGEDFVYRPLWPAQMYAYVNLPIPASITAALGWNRLAGGPTTGAPAASTSDTSTSTGNVAGAAPQAGATKLNSSDSKKANQFLSSDAIRAIQEEFERLARRLRRPEVGRADGRFPIYVIFSTRKGLETQYGPQTAAVLDTEMHRLADAVRRTSWGAVIFYADDPSCTATFGVKPAAYNDPWKLKLAIADLDKGLAKKGEMIGSLLIVGGPQVVPFHHLPNPTDDSDADVVSDNPYATLDENYFIPEWPVGRLPGGDGSDAGLLLGELRKAVSYHQSQARPTNWFRAWVARKAAKTIKSIFARPKTSIRMRPSFGYTAAVWRKSSVAVFKPIGDSNAIVVSPPARSGGSQGTVLTPANLCYFNLHGMADSPEWYGQRDLRDTGDGGPDYPVALSPKDVLNHGQAPKIIFSEACYGVHIEKKNEDQAISLKFLSSGAQAVVGSSCIAYGSVATPLIAADLIGNEFWKRLREGQTVGQALLQAKVNLVQEMNKRQGYLDGEDQKTLISFMLFGDPLMKLDTTASSTKSFVRQRIHPSVKTVSDQKEASSAQPQPVPETVVAEVKKIVAEYLPGLEDAELRVSKPVVSFVDVYEEPMAKSKKSIKQAKTPQTTVVTLSKEINIASHVHHHYARVTLDNRGKMVKLSVSR